MMYFAGSLKPSVIRASPVGHGACFCQAPTSSAPAARKITPHTATEPSLAAFTMASASSVVMSAMTAWTFVWENPSQTLSRFPFC